MIFSEEFLNYLKNNPLEGTINLVKVTREHFVPGSSEWQDGEYQALLEAYALIIAIVESGTLKIETPNFGISGDTKTDCIQINGLLKEMEEYCALELSRLKFDSLKLHFKTTLSSGFSYEFSQGDLEKVQVSINQIWSLISQTNGLEKDHQQRLMSRLERLQSEMHKKVSDLDRFWGLKEMLVWCLGSSVRTRSPLLTA